ncbi:hypothetical protein [Paralcaligenes ginsengisoli]
MHEMEPKDSGDDLQEHPLVTFGREKRYVLESMAEFRRKASDSERKIEHIRRAILGDKKLTLEQAIDAITRLSPSAMDLVVLLVNSNDLEDRFEKGIQAAAAGARSAMGRKGGEAEKLPKTKAYALQLAGEYVSAHTTLQWAGTIANAIKARVYLYSRCKEIRENLSENSDTLKTWIKNSNLSQKRR